jgi:1-acyl-sn-glycerol-3-phosphate acyltransferase
MANAIVVPQLSGRSIKDGYLYFVAHVLFRIFVKLFVKVHGLENVPRTGPIIIAANHIRHIDPWWIGLSLPLFQVIHWVGKRELFDVDIAYRQYQRKMPKFVAAVVAHLAVHIVRRSFTISIDRDGADKKLNKESFKIIHGVLRKRGVIGMFPEGGTNRRGQITPTFVSFARMHDALIVPTYVNPDDLSVTFRPAVDVHAFELRVKTRERAKRIMELIYQDN